MELYFLARVKEDITEDDLLDCQQAIEDVLRGKNLTIEVLKSSTDLDR